MRVLVCGGRGYKDKAKVYSVLDALLPGNPCEVLVIIQGGAQGADALAKAWANETGVRMIEERARWNDLAHPLAMIRLRADGSKYNAAAGPIRNQKMLDEHKPDLCLAFPGGTGTADMVRRAKKAGIEVREIE